MKTKEDKKMKEVKREVKATICDIISIWYDLIIVTIQYPFHFSGLLKQFIHNKLIKKWSIEKKSKIIINVSKG